MSVCTVNVDPEAKLRLPLTVNVPIGAVFPSPGDRTPATATSPLITPVPASTAPVAVSAPTVTGEFNEPFTVNVPTETVVAPVYVFVPDRVTLPAPSLL